MLLAFAANSLKKLTSGFEPKEVRWWAEVKIGVAELSHHPQGLAPLPGDNAAHEEYANELVISKFWLLFKTKPIRSKFNAIEFLSTHLVPVPTNPASSLIACICQSKCNLQQNSLAAGQ